MSAVAVKEELLQVATLFGDAEAVIADAVRRYAIDHCVERIEAARHKIRAYEAMYGAGYKAFSERVQTDESFLKRVEKKNVIWEEDAIEWKHRVEEVEEWTKTLERILKQ